MSIKIIESQMQAFLRSTEPEVLAVKGSWGTGKTHTWDTLLKANKTIMGLEKYCYVSLFGIESIEALKRALFHNILPRDSVGIETSIDNFKRNWWAVSKKAGIDYSRKSTFLFRLADYIPFLNGYPVGSTMDALTYLSISKTLICIDDLERGGDGLTQRQVLGLISQLKEQKKCKIIILLNDQKGHLDDYTTYREKVIDQEISFNPSPKECSKIAFASGNDYDQVLIDCANTLQIRNIRVLIQISRLAKPMMEYLEKMHPLVKQQALTSLTLFAWSFYSTHESDNVPPLTYICEEHLPFPTTLDSEEEPDNIKRWKEVLERINFRIADDFDLEIKNIVTRGYVDKESLTELAQSMNDRAIAEQSGQSLREAWHLYQLYLTDNEGEVVNAFLSAVSKFAKFISARELALVVALFRELDRDALADDLIHQFIEANHSTPEKYDAESVFSDSFSGPIEDKNLRDALRSAMALHQKTRTPEEIIQRVSETMEWSADWLDILREASPDELFDEISRVNEISRRSTITCLIQAAQYDYSRQGNAQLLKNLSIAVKRIAGLCKINQVRMRKLVNNLTPSQAISPSDPSTQQ